MLILHLYIYYAPNEPMAWSVIVTEYPLIIYYFITNLSSIFHQLMESIVIPYFPRITSNFVIVFEARGFTCSMLGCFVACGAWWMCGFVRRTKAPQTITTFGRFVVPSSGSPVVGLVVDCLRHVSSACSLQIPLK